MSRGTKVVLNYAPQTDVATKPTTNWKNLPYKSEGLDLKVELTDSETIVDSRIKTAGVPTKATVEGDIEVEFAKRAFDEVQQVLSVEGQKSAHFAFKDIYHDYLRRAKEKGRVQEMWVKTKEPKRVEDQVRKTGIPCPPELAAKIKRIGRVGGVA